MTRNSRVVQLPRLKSVTLVSFSLYTLRPRISMNVDDGVFCLAGANGLGKSSFIAALNYGLTGGIAPPRPRFDQLPKYAREARAYSEEYFTGRINELDRGAAEISLEFDIGDVRYSITRQFFAPYSLKSFSVRTQGDEVVLEDDPALDDEARHSLFETRITEDAGLQTFPQFMFLQHFVFTFDERRQLLFWDSRASELVLYLALGLDPSLARRADELRKQANAAGSLARNAQYQATVSRRELRRVAAQMNEVGGIPPDLMREYETLQERREAVAERRDDVSVKLADARLEYAEASATQMRLRQEYEEVFRQRIVGRSGHHLNALVAQTLGDHRCRICGTQHGDGPELVAAALEANRCPLCAVDLPKEGGRLPRREELARLDENLVDATTRVSTLSKTIARLEADARAGQRELADLQAKISALEEEHDVSMAALKNSDQRALTEQLSALQAAVDMALSRKEEQLQKRSDALASFEPIQAALTTAWSEAEVDFVPRFRKLAESFIGLPIQISLDTGSGMFGIAHLALTVNSSHRRKPEQLSESQRFFLDIALRMSLAQHMTQPNSAACLYIDTPEGALDIAYEARAGEMFSSFTQDGDQIVMTANVNTSQLLRRMARRCGRDRMKLVRMTEWTTLSDVQSKEEDLFREAFEEIEEALEAGPGKEG